LMFKSGRKIGLMKGLSVCSSLDEFTRRFHILTYHMFEKLNWNNIFIAGGSILACLLPIPDDVSHDKKGLRDYYHGTIHNYFSSLSEKTVIFPANTGFQNSDFDIFLYGLNEKQASEKIDELYYTIKSSKANYESDSEDDESNFSGDEVVVLRTARTITLTCGFPRRHVQIVLRLYKSPAEVLLGFDVDCVGVGYDGTSVYCLPRTRRALTYRYNIADPSRQTFRTNSYEYRLWKYSNRGFAVAVPGMSRKLINPEVYTKRYSELKGFSKLLYFEVRENQSDVVVAMKYKGKWFEQHGFKYIRENYNKTDSLNMVTTDIISMLNDYNDGLFQNYCPGKTAKDFFHELYAKFRDELRKDKPIGYIFGWDLATLKNSSDFRVPTPYKSKSQKEKIQFTLPPTIKWIGSLADYIQSLPDVEDDWFADVY